MNVRVIAVGLLCLVACSAEQGDSGGSGRSGASSATNPFGNVPTGSGTDPSAGGDFGNPTGGPPTISPGINSGAGKTSGVEFSYIWIANSAEGTVSKIDTRTLTELGRYRTRPDGLGRPSRTSVAQDGSVAVANRDGGVTKILAKDCPDKNGNATVETSTGASDIKAWGEDECVAWHTPMQYFSNRPVAWAPAPAPDVAAKVWTAAAFPPGGAGCTPTACSIDVMRLNGDTGNVDDKITISGLSGTDFISAGLGNGIPIPFSGVIIDNYGPYGGASDGGGNFWVFVGNTTQLMRVDTTTLEHREWPIEPVGNGYGITVDEKGRVFICGALGISRFDPATETWISDNSAADLGMNGCMTDGHGKIWVGGGSDQGALGLHGYDAESLALIGEYPVGTVKGVSIDVDGFIWGVSSPGFGGLGAGDGSSAWRVDPASGDVQHFQGLSGAYSYSDMTGFGLSSAGYTPLVE